MPDAILTIPVLPAWNGGQEPPGFIKPDRVGVNAEIFGNISCVQMERGYTSKPSNIIPGFLGSQTEPNGTTTGMKISVGQT
jgi:hypothetical protein